ncbi:DegV family protein [Biformimicrobium ophioploci]|uniref:DegV family protein n=1 Tax=Biformimicrobium ophioploci TaxID=3036711 RepID=A0ABQ6LXT0_9GAMM|nr:DegV family protein [Microbulbifer sp. NKW57]GMG86890.1 DegV family protein [Microbulbifer sp. NKW57]
MVQLVVDSGCDLPDEFLRKFNIPVLPHTVSFGKEEFGDQRNPAQMSHFYTMSLVDSSHQIVTGPAPEPEIEAILQRLRKTADRDIVVQTINSTNSPTYANLRKVASKMNDGQESAQVHPVDSHTLFSGQGLLALYTLSLIQKGFSGEEIREKAETFGRKTWGFAAIKDVYYLRKRARSKNEDSVGWLKAMMARLFDLHPIIGIHHEQTAVQATTRGFDQCTEKLFDLAIEKIQQGKLILPAVVVSIAGKLEDIDKTPGFRRFEAVAREHKVKVYKSLMSLSGGINLGPGTVALALAEEDK